MPRLVLILVLSMSCLSCGSRSSGGGDRVAYRTGNADFDRMLALALTIAQELLKHDDSFVPFGTAVKTGGELTGVLAIEPRLSTSAAVNRTIGELVRGARTGAFRSTAMCTDVVAPLGDSNSVSDAISVLLEDDRESRGFILPYVRHDDGRLEFGTAYFREENSLVFRPSLAL